MAAAAITICLAAGAAGCSRNAAYYVDKGRKLLAEGKAEEAALNYRKAIQQNGRSAEALYGLGQAEVRMKNATAAWQNLREAVRLNPRHAGAAIALADLALAVYASGPERMRTAFDTARDMADALVREHPELAAGHRLTGQIALLESRGGHAVRAFRSACARDAKDPAAAIGLVEALLLAGDVTAAVETERQWSSRYGGHRSMTAALYRFHVSAGDLAAAEKILLDRVGRVPDDVESKAELARLYGRTKRAAEADRILTSMVHEAGRRPEGAILAGDYYRAAQQDEAALSAYQAGTQGDGPAASACAVRAAAILRAAGQWGEAIRILEESLRKHPDDPGLAAARIEVLLDRGAPADISEAVKSAAALAGGKTPDAAFHFLYGRALYSSGDRNRAAQQFNTAARISPGRPEARLALATLALAGGNPAEALSHADAVLAADPENAVAVMMKAEALKLSGALTAARAELIRLLAARPGLRDAELQLAEIDLVSGNKDKAAASFRRLFSAAEDARALRGVVASEIARGNTAAALALLERKASALPPTPDFGALIVRAGEAANKLDSALGLLNRVAKEHPRAAAVHASMADLHSIRGDYPAALRSIETVRQLDASWPALDAVLGSVLERMNDAHRALRAYETALRKDPQNAKIRNNIANLLVETGRSPEEALRVLQPVLRDFETDPTIRDTLAWLYVKQGKADRAIEMLQPLIGKYPGNAGFRYHLAMAYLAKGDTRPARRHLQAALGAGGDENTRSLIRSELKKLT
jgi:tetratricopeptide (TPR) repeat protein